MINKKFFVIFTLSMAFLLCVGAISAASDDLIDEGVSEIDSADDSVSISNDEQAIDVDSSESALDAEISSDDVADEEMLAASDDDSDLAIDPSEEKLAVTVTASYDLYSITLEDAYIIEAYSKGTIEGYVSTPKTYMPQAGFKIYMIWMKICFIQAIHSQVIILILPCPFQHNISSQESMIYMQ